MHHAIQIEAAAAFISSSLPPSPEPGKFLGDAATAIEHVMADAHEANRISEVLVLHRLVALLRAAATDPAVTGR